MKVFPFDFDQRDFANGLRLVTIPTGIPGPVTLYIVVQAGSRNEVEPGRTGFAHFFEHMMFRGTKRFPPERYEKAMQAAGAATNAYTDDDLTAYHTTIAREDLESILDMEADRFQHLDYPEEAFRTEALAVLGEYNKDSTEPAFQLFETLRATAFDASPYRHTTMGFLADIENMPNLYEYSRAFHMRFYRPEYTTILVAGDIAPDEIAPLVERYWGGWQRGGYLVEIPAEPRHTASRRARVAWKQPTPPWVNVAYQSPGYWDDSSDSAALDLMVFLGFSESSPLYRDLVIEKQIADIVHAENPDRIDPYLFTAAARVRRREDVADVIDAIEATFQAFRESVVDEARLDAVKRRLRYGYALGLNSSEAIAASAARYVALRRTPGTINRLHEIYASLTPGDLQAAARKYFVDTSRAIVTLSHEEPA